MVGAVVGGFASVAFLAVVATGGIGEIARQAEIGRVAVRGSIERWHKNARSHSLESADVAREVEKAVRRQDLRFVVIGGVGPFFPGLEKKDAEIQPFVRRYGYRYIDGTSDVVDSPEQMRFQTAAYEYARSYNTRLYSRVVGR